MKDVAMGPRQLVSLIIPLYNQLHYTQRCLESIVKHTSIPYEIILIDNASQDGTQEFVRTVKATVISNDINLGCARAWNQGVKASQGRLIGILNNDIVVSDGWLGNLVAFLGGSRHGIVSPAAREGQLNYDLDGYAKKYTRRCSKATRAEIYGACMLIDRRVFDQVGLFDEAFSYGGCEDVDFQWRAEQAGFSVGMTGSALIHHYSMVTQDAIKLSESTSYPADNMAHFEKKWNRSVRGNWGQRRWSDVKAAWCYRMEKLRYGHTLIEKPNCSDM